MTLTQAQREALTKVDGGTDILEGVDGMVTEIAQLKSDNKKISGNDLNSRKALSALRTQFKAVGLDIDSQDKSIADQLEELQEKTKEEANKGMKSSAEVEKLAAEIKNLKTTIESEKTARLNAENAAKLERARSTFSPLLTEHFIDPSIVLESLMNKGSLTVDENNVAAIKIGEELITDPEKVITALRQLYPKLAVAKQKGGAGDTAARGGEKDKNTKTITSEEYNAKAADPAKTEELQKFFKDGGVINDEQQK